ncbi:MAG: transposase domain-containing protein [Pseudonocardia sp.]|nr:transposase domain-containing protein [Pseudonocardia sp.]
MVTTDSREQRRRLLPARLVVYFVLALWFRGPNCGYGRVMTKLVDVLYHRRHGAQLLDGVLDPAGWVDAGAGRRWRPPNISSLSRARTRLGADPLHLLFDQVAGPVGGSALRGQPRSSAPTTRCWWLTVARGPRRPAMSQDSAAVPSACTTTSRTRSRGTACCVPRPGRSGRGRSW